MSRIASFAVSVIFAIIAIVLVFKLLAATLKIVGVLIALVLAFVVYMMARRAIGGRS